jgi:radical SAM protein (TIGR01212 family)
VQREIYTERSLDTVKSTLADFVNTFGQAMLACYGKRVHKVAIDAAFTCPNRDGTKGRGGCTFCNNASFSPNGLWPVPVSEQLESGRRVIQKRTGARCYIAYFQTYTNTYAKPEYLRSLYDQVLAEKDVIGLSVGTRPDCVPSKVLDLLVGYQDRGYEVWLELGLQSSFDHTLKRVNRGHGYAEYHQAVLKAHRRGLKVCTHLMLGLPGENELHAYTTLHRVLDLGTEGLKIHPLHVVRGTRLANEWRRGEYTPLIFSDYITTVCDLIEMTPPEVIYHRLTGTASAHLLLAPFWCGKKWEVLNGIRDELKHRGTCQGSNFVNGNSCMV